MRTLNIANAREIIEAYGQSSSTWAASTINTWLGVILGVVTLVSTIAIVRDTKKDESQKVKSVALLIVAVGIAGGAVMMFINNKYGGPVSHATDALN
jgi:hypothetical protein